MEYEGWHNPDFLRVCHVACLKHCKSGQVHGLKYMKRNREIFSKKLTMNWLVIVNHKKHLIFLRFNYKGEHMMTRYLLSFVSLHVFFFLSLCHAASLPAVHGQFFAVEGQENSPSSPPDLSELQNINEQYFASCETVPDGNTNYKDFDKSLQEINSEVWKIINQLAENNKKVRKAVTDISKGLNKINTSVVKRDIRKTKRKVLQELEKLKGRLATTRESIVQIKTQVDESQRVVAATYCRVDQYVTLNQQWADEAEERKWMDKAVTDRDTARDMSGKRWKLFQVMRQFDRYYGLLDGLFSEAEHKLAFLESVQLNIISYVDTQCHDKHNPCRYQPQSDLRFNEAVLNQTMANLETAFMKLVETTRANFSEYKSAHRTVKTQNGAR